MDILIGEILLMFSAIMSSAIFLFFILVGRHSRLRTLFLCCQAAMFLWTIGHFVEIMLSDANSRWYAACFENLPICFIGFLWFLFSVEYTNSKLIDNRSMFMLGIFPGLMYIIFLTNSYHKMVYTVFEPNRIEYGVFFWIHIIFTYLCLTTGTFLIIRYTLKMMGKERKQSILMIIAVSIPFISNILHISKVINTGFDLTPISFCMSLLLFGIATFKYRFLNPIPAGLKKVFDTVDDAILLIDNEGLIVSANFSFNTTFIDNNARSFNEFADYIGKTPGFSDESVLHDIMCLRLEPFYCELKINISGVKIFRVSIHPIFNMEKDIIGRVASFSDLTLYIELADELAEKNLQLTTANEQLRQHMLVVEELAMMKERNRVAREIHDTLGHTLTFLTKVQEAAIMDIGSNIDKAYESIKKANEIARNGLRELRISLHDMVPEKHESGSLKDDLERLASSFKSSGVCIEVLFDGNCPFLDHDYSQAIYRVCQEAVTNSIRHGKANEIHIMLRFNDGNISLYIIDNGGGCGQINKGFGLKGMEERIEKLSGSILFGSSGESGFNIHAEIPIGGGL